MGNKYLWAIGGLVLGYYLANRKSKKAVKNSVDLAVDTIQQEAHDNFNQAIDLAMKQGIGLEGLKQIINEPDEPAKA